MNIKKIIISSVAVFLGGLILPAGSIKAAATIYEVTSNLAIGSSGQDIKLLQEFLNDNGYVVASSGSGSPGNETTFFGSATKAALKKFQAANGVTATGYFGPLTRAAIAKLASSNDSSSVSSYESLIESLRQQIAAAQQQLLNLSGSSDSSVSGSSPYISSMVLENGGSEGYVDAGDIITINFSQAIDPTSINSSLSAGSYVTSISFLKTGGVSVSSSGVLSINGIATFGVGTVDSSGNFVVKLALDSTAKILTITLTSGESIEITKESFGSATQVGGYIKSKGAVFMESASINSPTGTFGGTNSEDLIISSIVVSDGGYAGYIDEDDTIKITFNKAIDPTSINSSLEAGGSVSNISYSQTGGVKISSSGKVTIKDIATFDMGSVENSESGNVNIFLNSSGKTLTIILSDDFDVKITAESFTDLVQVGGYIKDKDGNKMQDDSSVGSISGTFGGVSSSSSGGNLRISSIDVSNGGSEGYIDLGDKIIITFNKAIDPESINSSLSVGSQVSGVLYSQVGGVSVSSEGMVTVKGIASFDAGNVASAGDFAVRLALDSSGKILTITLSTLITGKIEITQEDFTDTTQIGGYVEDEGGSSMPAETDIDDPEGTFGGESVKTGTPYILSIVVTNGGEKDYIDIGDTIAITFSEAIDPESINEDLSAGSYVKGVSYAEIGGVKVSSAGLVTVRGIATFYAGDVESSGTFTSKLALYSDAKTLTINLTSGSSVEINDQDLDSAGQVGGYLEDQSGNEMLSDSSILDPTGNF